MSVLGKERIIEALERQEIYCNPAPRVIQPTHIDVHLGQYVFVPRASEVPLVLDEGLEVEDYERFDLAERDFILRPGMFILAHTHEFIGSRVPQITTMFHLRSTVARLGLSHPIAGCGDPGFYGRWALELGNSAPYPIQLRFRDRIGCVIFSDVDGNSELYRERYNRIDNWKPEDILPRTHNVGKTWEY